MTNVLVFGWYNHLNIGDELFKEAFKKLFPQYTFIFTDHIRPHHLQGVDDVWFGGGSLLDGKPDISSTALPLLKTKRICYIGIGGETDVDPTHIELLQQAKLVALRSQEGYDKINELCPGKVILIHDLVFALLQSVIPIQRKPRSILFLPNISVVPYYDSQHWEHTHFENFKLEVSQVMDTCIQDGYKISFASMCTDARLNDDYATSNIVSAMRYRNDYSIEMPQDVNGIMELFASYELIITQRYHGAVLAEMTKTPYICIYHHDKLATSSIRNGLHTSYYGLNKDILLDLIGKSSDVKFIQMPGSFDELITAVNGICV